MKMKNLEKQMDISHIFGGNKNIENRLLALRGLHRICWSIIEIKDSIGPFKRWIEV